MVFINYGQGYSSTQIFFSLDVNFNKSMDYIFFL